MNKKMNKNHLYGAAVIGLSCLVATPAAAHSFSVHAHSQTTEHGSAAVTHIAWGHALPMDDFLQADMIETYEFREPSGAKHEFEYDKEANRMGVRTQDSPAMTIQAGDALANKISFKEGAPKGTYTVAAVTKQTSFSFWVDEKGKERFGGKTMDQIQGAKKFIFSANFQNFAKAFVSNGEWTEPKPVGHALEITPLDDLSKAKAGDKLRFRITLDGKPLEPDDKGEPKLKAFGEFYGADGTFSLQSGLNDEGIATLMVPRPGRWQIEVSTIKPVGPDNRPELVGKTLSAGYNATATFVVAP